MRILIQKNKLQATKIAAKLTEIEIKKKPNLVLGLAAGKTMIPFYKELSSKKLDFTKVKTFNLDEYIGLNPSNKKSFRHFMDSNLFKKINIKKNNINFLSGINKNLKLEASNYDKKINKSKGIDLQILGIGRNGHIGFNEPGSSFSSRTRQVILKKSTIKDNSSIFKKVPIKAITLGIKTILKAKKIILIASGKKKAQAIYKAIKGPKTPQVPASALQNHQNVIFILDNKAAALLK